MSLAKMPTTVTTFLGQYEVNKDKAICCFNVQGTKAGIISKMSMNRRSWSFQFLCILTHKNNVVHCSNVQGTKESVLAEMTATVIARSSGNMKQRETGYFLL